ncbi:MAG: DegV family protein [Chloroflexi bacterium]|nr:DegV family protein [Chloroflexota bacterium]
MDSVTATHTLKVAIVADSGCDLPQALLEQYEIGLVPLTARFGEIEIIDQMQNREEFWRRYDLRHPPQSAAPSVGLWEEAFEQALTRAERVIALTLTGKHSATFNHALMAASAFPSQVEVFDSWSLSLGEGLLVLEAARLARAGRSTEVILRALTQTRARLRVHILLDAVEAIQRGGRLGPAMGALKRMSSALSIKPMLAIDEGQIHFDGAVRSRKRGFRRLLAAVEGKPLSALAVAHTRNFDMAEQLADAAAQMTGFPRDQVLLNEAGPALGVHAGPGALGLAFVLEERQNQTA